MPYGEQLAYGFGFFVLWIVSLAGWHLLPNFLWGLYSLDDGELAYWNSISIFEWSTPFDLSPHNLFQGLGSQYVPNNPWLNPGALALSLPVSLPAKYYVSYTIYFVEVTLSIVLLGRTFGISAVRSVMAAQIFVIVTFPPFTIFFKTLPWISLAPFNAHLFAIANVALAIFVRLGRTGSVQTVLAGAAVAMLFVAGIFSSVATFVTFLPVYLIFGAALSLNLSSRRTVLWQCGLVVAAASALWALGAGEFYQGMVKATSRYHATTPEAASFLVDPMDRLLIAVNEFSVCDDPQFFLCPRYPVFLFHACAMAGAVWTLAFGGVIPRRLGIAMLSVFLAILVFHIAAESKLLGPLGVLSSNFLLFSSYSFCAIFTVVALSAPVDQLRPALSRLLDNAFVERLNSLRTALRIAGTLVFPLLGAWVLLDAPEGGQRDVIVKALEDKVLPPAAIKEPSRNAIIDQLARKVGVRPGDVFKGSVVTYFGDPAGPLRSKIELDDQSHFSSRIYTDARFYMQARYGTRFMFTDLWRLNIPTLEEYGQYVTAQLLSFAKEMLARPGDRFFASFVNVYKLDLDVLRALGVRFVITDLVLDYPGVNLVGVVSPEAGSPPVRTDTAFGRAGTRIFLGDAVPVRLYELMRPNLASYSPIAVIHGELATEIFFRLKSPAFSFERDIVMDAAVEGPFLPVTESKMEFHVGKIRVTAHSGGKSILLLPVQYSHCLKVVPVSPPTTDSVPRLERANLVQSAVIFERSLDIELIFDLGLGPMASCRITDHADHGRLQIPPVFSRFE